jgi:hypothetical protein
MTNVMTDQTGDTIAIGKNALIDAATRAYRGMLAASADLRRLQSVEWRTALDLLAAEQRVETANAQMVAVEWVLETLPHRDRHRIKERARTAAMQPETQEAR